MSVPKDARQGLSHEAALPLLKVAHANLKRDAANKVPPAWAARYVFFAPVGDVVHIADLDALKAAASPTVILIPHRYHDGRNAASPDAARVLPLACENKTRDWITPLSPPDRPANDADLTFYHLVPRRR